MIKTVRRTIEQFAMLENGETVVLGVSGGADSMCLLAVLKELAVEWNLQLHVVHVNHQLREEAEEEEAYVENICGKWKVSYHGFRKDIAAYAKEQKYSVEEAGRRYRYECFEDVCKQVGGSKIAVAHHKNDRAETLLFHMIRGTGMRGLGSIQPVRGNIIRPLLEVGRHDIEKYLKEHQIKYYDDCTNFSDEYTRSRIRNRVLPQLEEMNDQAVRHMAEVAENAREYWEYVENQAAQEEARLVMDMGDGECLIPFELSECPELLQRHIIYRTLTKQSGQEKDWELQHVKRVQELLKNTTGKQVALPYSLMAYRTYDGVLIKRNQQEVVDSTGMEPVPLVINGTTILEGFGLLECQVLPWESEGEISKKVYTKMLDYDKIKDTLCVRNPLPGDYFVVNEGGDCKKLSRYFIDQKIPKEQRERCLVLAAGQQICWIIGMRISEDLRIGENTQQVIKITFQHEGEANG